MESCSPPEDDSVDSSEQRLIIEPSVLLDLDKLLLDDGSVLVELDLLRFGCLLAGLALVLAFRQRLVPSHNVRPGDEDLLAAVAELNVVKVLLLWLPLKLVGLLRGERRRLKMKRSFRWRHTSVERSLEVSAEGSGLVFEGKLPDVVDLDGSSDSDLKEGG